MIVRIFLMITVTNEKEEPQGSRIKGEKSPQSDSRQCTAIILTASSLLAGDSLRLQARDSARRIFGRHLKARGREEVEKNACPKPIISHQPLPIHCMVSPTCHAFLKEESDGMKWNLVSKTYERVILPK